MNRLRVHAQLVRLPNLPTALADIALAGLALATLPAAERGEGPFPWPTLALLALASACLYCSGMVWNDFFDIEQDRRERPFRPLPSGKVTRREAAWLGGGLMASGLLLAFVAAWSAFVFSLALASAILLYDSWLKRTQAGPLGMGLCRFLNVLMGASALGHPLAIWKLHLAAVVGLYIVGVTWFARTEARDSERRSLQGAAAVMLASLLLALLLPLHRPPGSGSVLFPYLLVVLGFLLGVPISRAVRTPTPTAVQAAVKRCLMGLIVLDAVLASGLAGPIGLAVLVLLLPSLALNWQKWLYAT